MQGFKNSSFLAADHRIKESRVLAVVWIVNLVTFKPLKKKPAILFETFKADPKIYSSDLSLLSLTCGTFCCEKIFYKLTTEAVQLSHC